MNIELRDVISGLPVATSTEVASLTTTAAEPLSYIAVMRAVVLTVPSTGISPWSSIACSPWTSIAGLNVPGFPTAMPMITANVGSTRCCTSFEFSVVNSSSNPVGSMLPAPTPTA